MKKFERPADLSTLTVEQLADLRTAATAEIQEINSTEGDLSIEQLDALEALLGDRDAIDARVAEVEAEASALAERQAALRGRVAEPEAEAEVVEETPADEVIVEEEPAAEVEAEPVLASGSKRKTVAAAASKAPAVHIKKEQEPVADTSLTTITAAANVPEFTAGQELADMSEVASAFLQRVQSFGGSNDANMKTGVFNRSASSTRHGVARIKRADREFTVDREMGVEAQFAVIMEAAKESRLTGGSLVAAAGWCAPSETLYDFCELETTEGLVDVPEVTARRGGIQFTKGPDFMTLFADSDFGFIQTEAVVEAGATPKPCYAVECPPFTEVRLDAIGFCITAGLLTNAAYPELVRRVLNLAGVGHARRKSQSTIQRISAAIGTAINWTEIGAAGGNSGLADTLGAVELQALRIRQSLAMSPTATIEGIAPYWFKAAARHELSRRLGLTEPFRITDADVENYFAIRNIRLQYVYDYQMLDTTSTATWTKFPDTVEIMLYPAGAFVRLVNDVISLDAVYDHDLLTGNQYTAAFMEEGIAVANTCGFGVKVSVALNYEGAAGFPQIGAGSGVTFAAA